MFEFKWQVVLPGVEARITDSVIEASVPLYAKDGRDGRLVMEVCQGDEGFYWSVCLQGAVPWDIAGGWTKTLKEAVAEAQACGERLVALMQAAVEHAGEVRAWRDK